MEFIDSRGLAGSNPLIFLKRKMTLPAGKDRVVIFIDGSNFYHGLKENLGFANINFEHLVNSLINPEAHKLIRVYYYNAPVNREEEPEKYKNQQRFFEYLRNLPFFEVKLGRLERRKSGMTEKGVDVKLAVDMVMQAVKNLYDLAILISADGDFADAVQAVMDLGKHVAVAYPKGGKFHHLRQICDYNIFLEEGKHIVKRENR